MTEDQYVYFVLSRYVVNGVQAKAAAENLAPYLQRWAGAHLSLLSYSGSLAKGTGNSISTDVDIFISLRADTPPTLAEIYTSLFSLAHNNGWAPRKQNVSIGISVAGKKIDLVPGKIQSGYQNYHSLYRNKKGSWTQTNIKLHVDKVSKSGRTTEIRAVKLWRDLHRLSFPSFFLELSVIEALKGRSTATPASNVLYALSDISTNLLTRRIIDPANTNNAISDDLAHAEKTAVAKQARLSASKKTWGEIIW